MIKSKTYGELIVISGTTCAGKGTLIRELLARNPNLNLSISYTSREKRENEIDGKDYYFVDDQKFEKIQYNKYYGTPKKEVKQLLEQGKDVILEIDVEGAKQIKEQFPQTILIFIMAPSMEEVKRRIKTRGTETKEQIIKRFKVAYNEINEVNKYNYVVVNDNLEEAIKKVEAILISEKCRVDRIEEIYMENEEEIIHEFLIDKEFDNTINEIE